MITNWAKIPKIATGNKPKIAFVCNHNSCRSQISEAIAKLYIADVFEISSAGTEIKSEINSDAVRLVKQLYNIDMNKTQYNKTIYDIEQPDIVIFMGCNVACPTLKSTYSENWQLDDPTGKSDNEFIKIIELIEMYVKKFKERYLNN